MSTAVNYSMYGGQDMAATEGNDMISCSESELIGGESDLNDLLNGTDLNDMLECEEFTDFSDLLLDLNGQPFQIENEQFQPTVSAVNVTVGVKRTTFEAFPEVANPRADHNYHVPSKKKSVSSRTTDLAEEHAVVGEVCDVDGKYMRYLERRRKNNAASKRSRETKKNRMAEMEVQAVNIEQENEDLRVRIAELDRLTKLMKSMLVQKVSSG